MEYVGIPSFKEITSEPNGHSLHGKKLHITEALLGKNPSCLIESHSVFVHGIVKTIDIEKLKEEFSVFGPVQNIIFVHKLSRKKHKRNFGFLEFVKEIDAQFSIKQGSISIDGITVSISLCKVKERKSLNFYSKLENPLIGQYI